MPFPLFPEQASSMAPRVDTLYFTLIGLASFFALLVIIFIVYFVIKYRRGSTADRRNPLNMSIRLEVTWTVIPLLLSLGIFSWGANLYFQLQKPPDNALEIYAVGKQWMWKFQHPEGQREIDQLHVPTGRPIKVILASQDVIHSFFVPAFRIKQDAIPGRLTTIWFEATKPGVYHLFCSEYCGTDHSHMGGSVIVLDPAEYQQWLAGTLNDVTSVGPAPPPAPGSPQSLAARGEDRFRALGCSGCHLADGSGAGPSLVGVYGHPVPITDDGFVTADDQYIRDSILLPQKQVVAGYPAIMPSFQGQISEDELMELIAYIKALAGERKPAGQ
ncbi:MAG: cytochrome c oxidase subunit II [Caldilinea sp. CFX5]|nr:cytochrome c oxidase subunit II [Caldilinea sp. CFX5]